MSSQGPTVTPAGSPRCKLAHKPAAPPLLSHSEACYHKTREAHRTKQIGKRFFSRGRHQKDRRQARAQKGKARGAQKSGAQSQAHCTARFQQKENQETRARPVEALSLLLRGKHTSLRAGAERTGPQSGTLFQTPFPHCSQSPSNPHRVHCGVSLLNLLKDGFATTPRLQKAARIKENCAAKPTACLQIHR